MVSLLELLWVVAAPAGAGVAAVRALGLRPGDDRWAFWGWAWLAGGLGIGLVTHACCVLGVPRSWWWTAPVPVLLLALPWWRRAAPAPVRPPAPSRVFVLGALLVVGLCVLQILAAYRIPVVGGDEGNIWSLKAKTLWLAGGFGDGFLDLQDEVAHPDYPLLNPLLQVWVHATAGEILHFANRLPVQGFALATLLVVAGSLRRGLHPLAALLLLALLGTGPVFLDSTRYAYADLMVAAGWVTAWTALLRWREEGGARWLRLAGLGAAVALGSKNEATLHLLAAAAGLLWWGWRDRSFRPGWRGIGRLAALPLLVVGLHRVTNARLGLHNDLMGDNPTGRSMFALALEHGDERLGPLLGYAAEHLFTPGFLAGVPAAFLLLVVLAPRRAFAPPAGAITLAALISAVGVHFVYLGTHLELRMHLDTSYARLGLQWVPVMVVWLGVMARMHGPAPLRPRRDVVRPQAGSTDSEPSSRCGTRPDMHGGREGASG